MLGDAEEEIDTDRGYLVAVRLSDALNLDSEMV